MTYKLNPFTGKLDTSDGPQGPAGVVSAAGPGSQGTPSISFAADLDTGLYNYTANGIAVSTGGTGRLFVSDNGVATGGAPQFGYGGIQVRNDFIYLNEDGANTVQMYLRTSSSEPAIQVGTNHPFKILTNNQERLRITSDGKLGLGTSAPATELEVKASSGYSELRLTGASAQGSSIEYYNADGKLGDIFYDNNSNLNIRRGASNTSSLYINSSGNVGIGTTSPSYPLSILSAGNNFLQFSRSGDSVVGCLVGRPAGIDALRLQATENIPIEFLTNNQERARIDSSGRLGLGTSSPSQVLDVSADDARFNLTSTGSGQTVGISIKGGGGGGDTYNYIESLDSNGAQKWYIGSNGTANTLAFKTNGNNERMRIDSSGNVGIGTQSPAYQCVVEGSTPYLQLKQAGTNTGSSRVIFGDADTASPGQIIYDHSNSSLQAVVNGTERARIDSSGRLLVGTTSSTTNGIGVFSGFAGTPAGTGVIDIKHGGTVASAGNDVGQINFYDTAGQFAQILCEADGTTGAGNYPGRLVFSTTADGESSPTPRMTIKNDGKVGIGTTSPSSNGLVTIAETTNARLYLTDSTLGDTYGAQLRGYGVGGQGAYAQLGVVDANTYKEAITVTQQASEIIFSAGTTERARIDSSGRLLVGTASSSAEATVVLQGSSVASGGDAVLNICRGSTPGSTGVGVELGKIKFGDDSQNVATEIKSERDEGTWTAGSSHPGRLVFSTTADSASSPTERMRISSNGGVAVGNVADDYPLEVSNSQVTADDATARFSDTKNVSNVAAGATTTLISGSGGAAYMVYVHRTDSTNRSVFGMYLSGTAGSWTSLATGAAAISATIAINGNDLEITNNDTSERSYLVTAIRMS